MASSLRIHKLTVLAKIEVVRSLGTLSDTLMPGGDVALRFFFQARKGLLAVDRLGLATFDIVIPGAEHFTRLRQFVEVPCYRVTT